MFSQSSCATASPISNRGKLLAKVIACKFAPYISKHSLLSISTVFQVVLLDISYFVLPAWSIFGCAIYHSLMYVFKSEISSLSIRFGVSNAHFSTL
jgi:hypothetical protein